MLQIFVIHCGLYLLFLLHDTAVHPWEENSGASAERILPHERPVTVIGPGYRDELS
jgi:hypothetical protein